MKIVHYIFLSVKWALQGDYKLPFVHPQGTMEVGVLCMESKENLAMKQMKAPKSSKVFTIVSL